MKFPEEGALNKVANDNIKQNIARNIQAERKKKGWSQAELAKMMDLGSPSALRNWETEVATPDITKLAFLADLFDVSLDALCGREERVRNNPSADDELMQKISCCDDIGADAIAACVEFHYKRCTDTPKAGPGGKKSGKTRKINRLFLVEDKDENYKEMADQVAYLKKLRKAKRKGYIEITRALWAMGYGDEICLAFVMDIFGAGLNKRVPSLELYNDIQAILMDNCVLVSLNGTGR